MQFSSNKLVIETPNNTTGPTKSMLGSYVYLNKSELVRLKVHETIFSKNYAKKELKRMHQTQFSSKNQVVEIPNNILGSLKYIHFLTETGLCTRNKLRELEKFKVFNMLTLKYPREQSNCFSNNEVKRQTRLETSNFQIFKWTQVMLELRPRKDMYNYAKNEQKRKHKMLFSSKNLVMETLKKLIFLRIMIFRQFTF